MKNMLFGLCLMGALASHAFATEKPIPIKSDGRIYRAAYQAYNVIPLRGMVLKTTQVVFGPTEHIIIADMGDASYWGWKIHQVSPNIMSIKPTRYPSNTNMNIVTRDSSGKERFYYFHLTSSHPGANEKPIYSLHFYYPQLIAAQKKAAAKAKALLKAMNIHPFSHPKNYNWDYSYHGSYNLRPVHVFDDGVFTYIQFQKNKPIPAIFAVDNAKGSESVVNYRKVGQYVVIQQVAPQFTLRDGKHDVASIFNRHYIQRLKHQGV